MSHLGLSPPLTLILCVLQVAESVSFETGSNYVDQASWKFTEPAPASQTLRLRACITISGKGKSSSPGFSRDAVLVGGAF